MNRLGDLETRLDNLKVQYQQNKDSVRSASDEAMLAQDLAEQAEQVSGMNDRFDPLSSSPRRSFRGHAGTGSSRAGETGEWNE